MAGLQHCRLLQQHCESLTIDESGQMAAMRSLAALVLVSGVLALTRQHYNVPATVLSISSASFYITVNARRLFKTPRRESILPISSDWIELIMLLQPICQCEHVASMTW